MVAEVHQLEVWRRWSWSQARELLAGQSVEDLLEVEVRPEQSTEARGLVEAGSPAQLQDKDPGVEGKVPGDNCSVVWDLQGAGSCWRVEDTGLVLQDPHCSRARTCCPVEVPQVPPVLQVLRDLRDPRDLQDHLVHTCLEVDLRGRHSIQA